MALNESNPGGAERDPRLDRLYRDAVREAPPAHLDSAILAAARREAGARPRPASTALRRWRVPVSIAAVLVVTVSLVTLVQEKGGERIVRIAPVAPPAPPAAAPPTPIPPTLPREPEKAPVPATAVSPTSVRPAPKEDAARPSAGGILGDTAQRDVPAPAAQGAAGTADAPTDVKSQPKPFPDAAGAAERRAAPSPQAAPVEDDLAKRPPAAAPKADRPASAPARAKVLERSREGAAAGGEQRPAWHDLTDAPPQKWLERIAEYRRQGRIADADALLAEFKRRFPDHPLPSNGEAR